MRAGRYGRGWRWRAGTGREDSARVRGGSGVDPVLDRYTTVTPPLHRRYTAVTSPLHLKGFKGPSQSPERRARGPGPERRFAPKAHAAHQPVGMRMKTFEPGGMQARY